MFCSQCGTENKAEARYCQKCGNSLSSTVTQPTEKVQFDGSARAIWNPNAAASWSILLTPAFGSYIQMLNWRALDEPGKAASAEKWFHVSLGILVVYVLMGWFLANSPIISDRDAANGLAFPFLLVWYFSSGKKQGKYVKEKYGSNYARKPWGRVVLLAVAAFIGYFIVAAMANSVLYRALPPSSVIGLRPLPEKAGMFDDLIPKNSVNPYAKYVTPDDNYYVKYANGANAHPENSVGDVDNIYSPGALNRPNSIAIAELKKSPHLAPMFDNLYGPGAAQKVLGNMPTDDNQQQGINPISKYVTPEAPSDDSTNTNPAPAAPVQDTAQAQMLALLQARMDAAVRACIAAEHLADTSGVHNTTSNVDLNSNAGGGDRSITYVMKGGRKITQQYKKGQLVPDDTVSAADQSAIARYNDRLTRLAVLNGQE